MTHYTSRLVQITKSQIDKPRLLTWLYSLHVVQLEAMTTSRALQRKAVLQPRGFSIPLVDSKVQTGQGASGSVASVAMIRKHWPTFEE
jgi:hypothetical protein